MKPTNRHANFNRSRRSQRGVGLIEVLISVLVFSVGMLGMTSVQVTAKRYNYEATQRSIATTLARDIVERMRSNPGNLADYVVAELGSVAVTFTTDCNLAVCTPADLAERDIFEWDGLLRGVSETITIAGVTSNAGGLVNARACITNNLGNVSIAIVWRGVNRMTNSGETACGNASGLYDDGAALNVHRRVLVLTTFVGNA